MPNFDFAQRLAALATEADELNKTMLSPRDLHQLELCRDVMHNTAERLAGDRVREIYAADEDMCAINAMLDAEPGMRELLINLDVSVLDRTQAAGLTNYLNETRH